MESLAREEFPSDFGFGFNDVKFSDRTIRLHITPESTGSKPDPVSNGHEAVENNENSSGTTTMKTIHISSIILAAKSHFFYKLFSNGMVESNSQHIHIYIQESGEAAFMDLLKFMYTDALSSNTPYALVDVLIAADKYGVESCIKYCFQLLKKLPMSCESALLYLDLPSTVLMTGSVHSLVDDAKKFLVARFNDISKFRKEMLSLPLVGIEVVLSSDDLQVDSEDVIYDFVMEWARKQHYTKRGERRKILATHLLRLIRFPFLSCHKLEELLTCTDLTLERRSKLVFDAISLETPHRQLPPVKEQGRAYKLRPVKVIRFDSPQEVCKVYLDLKHEECARLLPSSPIYSQYFDLLGQDFYLSGERYVDEESSVHSFGLCLGMEGNKSLGVDCEFSLRKRPTDKFVGKYKIDYNFTEVLARGFIFDVPWDTFIAENSPYFINGVLHIRAVLKVKKD